MADNAEFADKSPGMSPTLSIVICTHNRPDTLEQLLDILHPQIPGQLLEVIVVDSASHPDAANRVCELVEGHVGVRLVRLDAPGVSVARNAGIKAVRAPWIGFIDDDELPTADWVKKAQALIARLPADCAACGGNVLPVSVKGKMPAIGPKWTAYLSTIDHAGEFDQTANPGFGIGHSVVRVAAIEAVGGFDSTLGRTGTSLLSGEEVLLLRRLADAGWRIWHSDTLTVSHLIEPERLTRDWVRRRAHWEGISVARILRLHDPKTLRATTTKLIFATPFLAVLNFFAPTFREFDLRYAYAAGFLKSAFSNAPASGQ